MPEQLILRYCSPTLAGIKTGNLFSYRYDSKDELLKSIRSWNKRLAVKGLRVALLKTGKEKALIYIYRPAKLEADLNVPMAKEILKKCGYPIGKTGSCMKELVKRLQKCPDFPHEIGLFLGYPPEDVNGFMIDSRKHCKSVGCWKVYGDVEKAEKIFQQYRKCTDIFCKYWESGITIDQMAVVS